MSDVPGSPDPAGREQDDASGTPTARFPITLVVVLAAGLLAVVLLLVTDAPTFTVIGSILLFLVIVRVGWFFLQQFATPPPPPPDPGTLRRVRLTYRCPVCGAEVRMTSAATDDPEPPRHCMEEMELVNSEE